MAPDTEVETVRLTVKVGGDQLAQVGELVALHRPYLKAHVAARAALLVGLKRIQEEPELLPMAIEQLTDRGPHRL